MFAGDGKKELEELAKNRAVVETSLKALEKKVLRDNGYSAPRTDDRMELSATYGK